MAPLQEELCLSLSFGVSEIITISEYNSVSRIFIKNYLAVKIN